MISKDGQTLISGIGNVPDTEEWPQWPHLGINDAEEVHYSPLSCTGRYLI